MKNSFDITNQKVIATWSRSLGYGMPEGLMGANAGVEIIKNLSIGNLDI